MIRWLLDTFISAMILVVLIFALAFIVASVLYGILLIGT